MAEEDGGKKPIPTKHKIDAYGSFILLIHIYVLVLVLATLSTFQLQVVVPHEMLLQGPITLDISDPDRIEKPLICNPHYPLFRESYITDEMKSFESVKSGEFIDRTDIQELLKATDEATNSAVSFFGIKNTEICEIIRPANRTGNCMSFAKIEKECLEGDCGEDPNVCFWSSTKTMQLMATLHLITFIPAVLMTMGMMYDPPPAGCRLILKPIIAAVLYCLTGVFAVLGFLMSMVGKSKYAPAIMSETYPGFEVQTGPGYKAFQINGIVNLVYAGIFLYLAIFAPTYPRHKNRWDERRQNLERGLEEIKVAKATE
uniref:uncharacterized protein LOC120347212 n=1 Tax=Styela clava TaxID=7725 RepID=UPI0019393B19|nr:uncharacterized protein LOC120347212 [Styela clava]